MSNKTTSMIAEVPLTAPRPHLVTARIYDSMIEKGILTEDDNVELLNGAILDKMPKGPKRAYFNDSIAAFLKEVLPNEVAIRNQNPILLGDLSEPEPDIVVCKAPRARYLSRLPVSEDVLLVVEVSDTNLGFDRYDKGLAYSRAGIPQYLIVNLESDTIEDYQKPGGDGYKARQTYGFEESFSLVSFPEIEINVSDLLKV